MQDETPNLLVKAYGCAILEELDYLCNLIGLQVLPHYKDSNKTQKLRQISQEELGESNCLWPLPANPFIFQDFISVAFPVHLLSLSFARKQVEMIHNHLFFLTG